MKKVVTPKIIIALLFVFILLLVYGFCSKFADNRVNDFFLRKIVSVLNVNADDKVVLVTVDKRSFDSVDKNWTRNLYSDIFDYLEFNSGAKAIVFADMVFSSDTYNTDADKYFYDNLSKHNILITSYGLLNSDLNENAVPNEYIELFKSKTPIIFRDFRKLKKYSPDSYKSVFNVPYLLLKNSNNMGYSGIPEDKDTVVRMYTPVVFLQDRALPSIALSAYAVSTGTYNFDIYDDFICSVDDCKSFKMPVSARVTTDYIGNETKNLITYIRWFNPINRNYTHKTYSAIDVVNSYKAVQSGKNPIIPESAFKDKIVIVGFNADESVWDNLSETPVLKRQADIDVHATMIDNMLDNVFKSVKSKDYTPLICLIFCVIIIFGFKNINVNLILAFTLSGIYLAYYLFEYFSCVYVPQLSPILVVVFAAIFKWIYSVVTVDKNAEMIKRAMGKYISKDVMKTVIKDIDKLKLGGNRTDATILFIDIRNFTGMSEKLSPSDVTSLLNEYFSVVEPIIAKYNGVINKYLGDGVLAIFGVPINDAEHAKKAIMCADEILQNVKVLQDKLEKENKPKIEIGVGINTGEVFAGNIGTEERLEYTIIGDSVNLAYRIESYNRILKTQFLISDYTYNYVKDMVDVVKLSKVSIKGKSLPIDIYEVLKVKKHND